MDETNEIMVSLDIGTTKVVAIVGKKNEHGKIEILGIGKTASTGVRRGIVTNITETANAITLAVEKAEKDAGVEFQRVVNVGIAGQHIKSLQHRGILMRNSLEDMISQDDVDALIEDMYKLVMLPGEKIIHVLPQEYIIDGEQGITQPIGMSGIRLEANFHIITGQEAARNNIYKCVEQAGLDVAELILEPLASAKSVLSSEEKEGGVVLVDIGGGTTDIAMFYDDIIRHTAVIPFGGAVITDDIQKGCKILKGDAEKLKVQFGSALADQTQENEIVSIPGIAGRDPKEISTKNLSHVIQARMEEILGLVDYEIKNSGFADKLIAGIVLTGGGSQLKHVAQLCEYVTGISTRVGYPNQYLSQGNVDNVTKPMYATGVGLVIKGFEGQAKEKKKEKEKIVANHSKLRKGNFFDWFSKKAEKYFEDDDVDQQ